MFTLVELLVAVAVLLVLASLLLPVLKRAMESTRRVTCLSNQKQLYLGLTVYAEDHLGLLPYGKAWYNGLSGADLFSESHYVSLEGQPFLVYLNDYARVKVFKYKRWDNGSWRYEFQPVFTSPERNAIVFCPSKDDWVQPSGDNATIYGGAFYASKYAHWFSGIGFASPFYAPAEFEAYGSPRFDRMGGPDGPIALIHEVFSFQGGGNHNFGGVNVMSERGVGAWIEGASDTMWNGGSYPSFAKAYYSPNKWGLGDNFGLNRPNNPVYWNTPGEMGARLRIYGYRTP